MKSILLAVAMMSLSVTVCQAADPVPRGEPLVIGQSYVLPSRVLNEDRRINVYLPDDYETSGKTYPVLYLLDGGLDADFHSITGLIQSGVPGMSLEPMIVIGVVEKDRRHDFTAPSKNPKEAADYPTTGGSAPFRQFLADEVQPWVTARYRTNGQRAVIGESLAALFVTETFLTRPEMFDTYVAISPSLWWDNMSLAQGAAAKIKAMPAGKRSLFLALADEDGDMRTGVDTLVAALKADAPTDLTWTYVPMADEHHYSVYHPAALKALRWRFGTSPNY